MRRFAVVKSILGTAALAATLAVAPLGAQSFKGHGNDGVPEGHRPPPGMCRIWIDGVPPGQQPAPTDCATAVRNRPANGRVIFGDDAAKPGKAKPKKFSGGSYSARDDDRTASDARRDDGRDDRSRNDGDRTDRARRPSDDSQPNGSDHKGRRWDWSRKPH